MSKKTDQELIAEEMGFYLTYPIISEKLHPNIQSVLDHPPVHTNSHHTFLAISRAVRGAIQRGEDTGLADAKPKKGSSRAVYFHKDPHEIHLDGQKTQIPSVLKVAFHGQLDHHNDSGYSLGEHQNRAEADHFTNHHYGIIREVEPGKYQTNHESGVLAPFLGGDSDGGHYIHQGKIHPIEKGDFRELTKTQQFPKGISHEEFHAALMSHHADAHGQDHYSKFSPEQIEHIQEHPFVEKVQNFVADTGHHPGDLNKRNMGVWHHPTTGERHLVIADYGYTGEVHRAYQKARQNLMNHHMRKRYL